MVLEDGTYHILCSGVKEEDMSSGSVSDGCIGITLEQSDGGYISIGPVDVKVTRNKKGKISKVSLLSKKEAEKLIKG